jgi:hypothetical protein
LHLGGDEVDTSCVSAVSESRQITPLSCLTSRSSSRSLSLVGTLARSDLVVLSDVCVMTDSGPTRLRSRTSAVFRLLSCGDARLTQCCCHCSTWMQQQGLTADQTYMYFVEKAHQIAIAQV